jgi:transcriptional regulator with XRE-family HTH domain
MLCTAEVKTESAERAMADGHPACKSLCMARTKSGKPLHYLREWRDHRRLTQDAVVDELVAMKRAKLAMGETSYRGVATSRENFLRIENGNVKSLKPAFLDLLATIYHVSIDQLLRHAPPADGKESAMTRILNALPEIEPGRLDHVADVVGTFKHKAPAEPPSPEPPKPRPRKRKATRVGEDQNPVPQFNGSDSP